MRKPWPTWTDIVLVLVVLFSLFLSSCSVISADYVEADRAVYDRLSPLLPTWIEADSTLSAARKDSLRDLIQGWDFRLRCAEAE